MKKRRKLLRLKNYNYSNAGYYFITICTKNKKIYFDNSTAKGIVQKCWNNIPLHFKGVEIDEFIIMPNHIHGIIIIIVAGDRYISSLQNNHKYQKLPTIVGTFKSAVSRELHKIYPNFQWQRSYYEHIIRNSTELANIRKYINENPIKWNIDAENPNSSKHPINIKEYYEKIYQGEI